MVLQFIINYASAWQEDVYVCGNIPELGSNVEANALKLSYLNNTSWEISIPIENSKAREISYYYFVKKSDGTVSYHACNYELECEVGVKNKVTIDTWVAVSALPAVFEKKIFNKVFFKKENDKKVTAAKRNVQINVKMPLMPEGQKLAMLGNIDALGAWDEGRYITPSYNNGSYTFSLNITADEKLAYKYILVNTTTGTLTYENGENRTAAITAEVATTINDGYVNIDLPSFKAAGVAIPVFSLRTKESFGVGEFTDIEKLVDWCKLVGIKLVQLLPINDTIATRTNKDSYPYSANSAFALHPMYINLSKVGTLTKTHKLTQKYEALKKQLNEKTALDFENVISFKLDYLEAVYSLDSSSFKKEADYIRFYNQNKSWLNYYAAYCYLRDKHSTVDFSAWKGYEQIDANKLETLISPKNKSISKIEFWFFVQYHLHLQLSAAVAYGHENGIAFKGDLPIGIGRTSCDAWQHPHLFHMHMQAGAPPDDFAVKGQNWGFPTYNWDAMQQDGFQWWKDRFAKMSDYFDAFRIDHILGFFRIWSIPTDAIDGILGHFVPAIAVHENEFNQKGVYLDKERFTKPHFTQQQLSHLFGNEVDEVKSNYFDVAYGMFVLKPEFDTQVKISEYGKLNPTISGTTIGKLIDCLNNIILIEVEGSNGTQFHFNIAMEKTMSFQLLSPLHQQNLKQLFVNYFYERQDTFWEKEAMQKLPILQRTTDMLICGEDLGMVPNCVPGVMQQMNMLSLEVQRMPKASGAQFVDLNHVPYLSVCTPSTHDMSTLRGWWEEDRAISQQFYNHVLGHFGAAPYYCESWLAIEIINQHLNSKSMWAIFQLQDLLAIDNTIRIEDPNAERINIPADPNHYWCYRMHMNLEELIQQQQFNDELHALIKQSNRCN